MTRWMLVIGWTLLHFVWQGAFIGAATASVVWLLRDSSARLRYGIASAALGVMLVMPVVTLVELSTGSVPAAANATLDPVPRRDEVAITDSVPFDVARPGAIAGVTVRHIRMTLDQALPIIVGLWAIGVACLLLRLFGGWQRVRRLHQRSLRLMASAQQPACQRLAIRLGVVRAVRVVDSNEVDTPTLVGWLRPIILLPLAALSQLTPEQVDAILAHELAHVRRYDVIVNGVQTVVETLLFYHPAVWWISARIRAEREHCCDDIAVEVCGDVVNYTSALVKLEAWRSGHPAFSLSAGGGSLRGRVRRVLQTRGTGKPACAPGLISIALVLMCGVIVGAVQDRTVSRQRALTSTEIPFPMAPPAPSLQSEPPFVSLPAPPSTTPRPRPVMVAAVQAPAPAPVAFETVSITPNTSEIVREMMNVWQTDGHYRVRNNWLRLLIAFAYRVAPQNVSGGPSWIDVDRFDIDAKADTEFQLPVTGITRGPGSEPEALVARVRTLLTDRFKLAVHHEAQARPAYALVLASGQLGPQLNTTTLDCRADAEERRRTGILTAPPPWGPKRVCGISSLSFSIISGGAVTMAQLADILTKRLPQPVVDRTGLSGEFDLDLKWTPDDARRIQPADGRPAFLQIDPNGPSVFMAVQEQLGLKLEPTTEPIDVLVIDHVEPPGLD